MTIGDGITHAMDALCTLVVLLWVFGAFDRK